jgi:uncharacterized protein
MENISAGQFTYFDDHNFPYGFRRSGMFTIKEAEYLESHGHTLRELENNIREPISEDEALFQAKIQSDEETTLFSVKTWRKYKAAIAARTERVFMSTYSGDEFLTSTE